jgi:hypothetical protein
LNWTPNLSSPNVVPYSEARGNDDQQPRVSQSLTPIEYGGPQPSTSNSSLGMNATTLRDAFITPGIDAPTLSSMMQNIAMSNTSAPLTTAVAALFEAITLAEARSPSHLVGNSPLHDLVRKFQDASSYFPPTLVHAGVSGPRSGARALQIQIRKCSVWVPNAVPLPPTPFSVSHDPSQSQSSSSIADSMQRIAADRQHRKDYIQWSRVHAAAIELGIMDPASRSFSEMMARDAVWEEDEVEWVAGIYVLRALIRTSKIEEYSRVEEYGALLKKYEGRWKEIRDEGRQELVTVSGAFCECCETKLIFSREQKVLLDAKEILMKLDKTWMK